MTAADRPPVSYGYDTAGRLQTISQTTGGVTELFTYGYDTLSRRTQLQRQANGAGIVTTDYEYDEISRLKRLKHTRVSTGTLHEDFQYEYNLDDEITKITSLASAPLTPQSKTATTADAANRIPQFGTASYSFNQEGQTTSKTDISGTTDYQWDARGRLTRATLPSGQLMDYGYDALGRRISQAANGLTTTFQYDGADVVIDRESEGNAYNYLNGSGIDDKLRQSGGSFGTLYFLQDHLGSTAALTGAGGALIEQQQYEAFGAGAGSVWTRYGYTGRERDELTGLVYYRARWFDSAQGRFLSEDPIGYEGGLNLYAYVDNNPIGLTDPMGLQIVHRPPPPPKWWPQPKPSPSDGKENCSCGGAGGNSSPGTRPGLDPMIGLVGSPEPKIGPAGLVVTIVVIIAGIALLWPDSKPESGGKVLPFRKPSPSPSPSPSPCPTPTPNTGKPGEWCNLIDQTGRICTYECPSGGKFTWFLDDKWGKCPPWKKVKWP